MFLNFKDIHIYFRPIRSQWIKLRFRQELTLRLTASFLDRAETGDVTATLGPKLVGDFFWGVLLMEEIPNNHSLDV